jgi:hypothetical protein
MAQSDQCLTSCIEERVLVGEADLMYSSTYDLMITSQTSKDYDQQLLRMLDTWMTALWFRLTDENRPW